MFRRRGATFSAEQATDQANLGRDLNETAIGLKGQIAIFELNRTKEMATGIAVN